MRFPVFRRIGQLLLCTILAAAPAAFGQTKPFSNEQLDQMLAQIALYPDALLSQVLMASTYPSEFQEAAAWSKANPDDKGDAAVTKVQDKDWDTSVASLVAFPEVLITLGDKPDYVKNLGDAFLAQPEDVMDSVQRLRAAAQKAGNLKSNEQIKVSTEPAPPPQAAAAPAAAPAPSTTVVQAAPPTQTIVIQPAQPSVVYVPAYNPAVVYGTWWWPSYPPYYYPPPPGYWFSRTIASGIAWGAGFAIGNALWGGFDWGHRDVDIDINRHNNINVNKQINVDGNRTKWSHNSEHRKNVSYRGGDAQKQRLDQQRASVNREQYRGKGDRTASREHAQQAMQSSGIQAPKGDARERAQSIDRDAAKARAQQANAGQARDRAGGQANAGANRQVSSADRDAARQRAQSADRDAARQRAQSASHDNAFKGVNHSGARAQEARGAASNASAQRAHAGGGGGRGGGGHGGGGHGRR